MNAYDPSGIGVFIAAPQAQRAKLGAPLSARYARLAAHLASAFRLRTTVATLEAIMAPSGDVVHATGRAKGLEARTVLVAATRAMERARGKLRRNDPDRAIGSGRALVAGRWSVVDHFETDGKRYLVARMNEPVARGVATLTQRERQVLEFAALDRTNKEIAYDLGIAAATVRVLLSRSARKLGARSRGEVIRTYRETLRSAGQ